MLSKKHALSLEADVGNVVSEHETTFFVCMSVKIEKSIDLTSSQLNQSFNCVTRRLQIEVWEMIETIEILAKTVHSVVP